MWIQPVIESHFDFDFCGFGHGDYDLAVFLWSSDTRSSVAKIAELHWAKFLAGYQSRSGGTRTPKHGTIPHFVICRRNLSSMGVTHAIAEPLSPAAERRSGWRISVDFATEVDRRSPTLIQSTGEYKEIDRLDPPVRRPNHPRLRSTCC